MITTEQKLLAIVSHIAWVLGGIGLVIVPLVIYLLKKEDPFVAHHAKQALVAQLTVFVLSSIVALATILLIGFLLIPAMGLVWIGFLVTSILAVIRAADGNVYYYPLIQPLVNRI